VILKSSQFKPYLSPMKNDDGYNFDSVTMGVLNPFLVTSLRMKLPGTLMTKTQSLYGVLVH
jgi:hypothetical protein